MADVQVAAAWQQHGSMATAQTGALQGTSTIHRMVYASVDRSTVNLTALQVDCRSACLTSYQT